MGRGRAKAKQAKVARQLKYSGGGTDLDRLRAELGVGAGQQEAAGDGLADSADDAYDDEDELEDEDDELEDEDELGADDGLHGSRQPATEPARRITGAHG
jgi:Protein of unknown function (DUF3073)